MQKPLAVIVGAGPGIGLAVARRFAQGGFRLALVSRPSDLLAEFRTALEAETQGDPVLVLGADLALEGAFREACAAIESWGGLP